MTEYVRTSVALRPEQKAALDEADRPMSNIMRDLVDGWRKHGATQEVFEEELNQEIQLIENEIESKQRRREQKLEQLERLQDDSLSPADEEKVQQYLDKSYNGLVWFNPDFDVADDLSTATLSAADLIKEVAKRAERTLPIDSLVYEYRRRGFDTLTVDSVKTHQFTVNSYQDPPSPRFVVELLEVRNETLQENESADTESVANSTEGVS